MEKIGESETTIVYKDFAHSPSKVKATVSAFKKQFTDRDLVACLELHTFSSLNETFLQEYKSSLDAADLPMVYYSPETIAHKNLAPISSQQVGDAFGNEKVQVFTDSLKLFSSIPEKNGQKRVVLLMSSGNFDGVNLEEIAVRLI
jgi:UDP-N-acetylmuramate: L-alanyl-gamma-D-glutamyl-meso-diaminopimelate ligase